MDLNQLLFHHQVALIRHAFSPADQAETRFDLVRHYQHRITRLRQEMGVPRYPAWLRL